MSASTATRWMLGILAGAFALRVWGLGYGLPDIYFTDEWFEVKRALKLGAGVFDLERVGKGGYYYLLFVVFGGYFAFLRVSGAVAGSHEFLLSIFRDPTHLWLVGRATTAVIGTLNVGLIYLFGRHLGGRAVGLLAAGMLAMHMMHVRSSHSITVDVPMVCALTAGFALLYAWRDRDDLTIRHYALLGAVAAVATATKLPAAVFAVCLLMFHVGAARRAGHRGAFGFLADRRWLGFLAGGLLYVVLEPGIVFKIGDLLRLLGSFFLPRAPVDPGTLPFPVQPDRYGAIPTYYWSHLFPLHHTILPLLFAGGAIAAWRRDGLLRHPGLVFAAIFAAFLVTSKNPHQIYARYVLPLVPIVLAYSASALVDLHRALRARPLVARAVAAVATAIVALPMLADSIRLDIDYGRPDTRAAARAWVERHVPERAEMYLAGSLVNASPLTAQLKMMPERVDEKVYGRLNEEGRSMTDAKSSYYEVYKQALAEYHPTYDLILLDDAEALGDALDRGRGEWALLVDRARTLFDYESNREAFPEQWRLWQAVESGSFEVVRHFAREPGWLGPNLTLYRRTEREAQP